MHVCGCVCVSVSVCVSTCICMCAFVCLSICLSVCVCVYVPLAVWGKCCYYSHCITVSIPPSEPRGFARTTVSNVAAR